MIDHQIHWHERLDNFRIATESFHRTAHRRQINHQRYSGEILQNNPRDDERNFFVGVLLRAPVRERLNIFASNFFAVTVPQHRLEHDPDADWQPRDRTDALFLERGQRMEKSFTAVTRVEFFQGLKFVGHSILSFRPKRSAVEESHYCFRQAVRDVSTSLDMTKAP